MSGYPEGLSSSDYCYMEGHIYADLRSPDPAARSAARHGVPPSRCARCGEVNYGLRAAIAAETRRQKRQNPTSSEQSND